MSVALQILDLARWAPSGDNTQPWRFEVRGDAHVVVHAFDTRRHCVYDLEGHASQLSVGALLETLRIAANAHQREAKVTRREEARSEAPVFDVRLAPVSRPPADALHLAIRDRSVARKPLSMRSLSGHEKETLESAVGDGYRLVWFESGPARLRLAWLAVKSAQIRLTIPEAYLVHRAVIEWGARYSEDRVPDQALGADALTLRFMRWAMASWERVQLLNRYFGGTIAPRLQLDLLPGLCCAAHFALVARKAPDGIDDFLAAGAAVQRFWLTAATLGLQLQPQYTPLVFAEYVRRQVEFTSVESAKRRARWVERRLSLLLGEEAAPQTVFLGRLGHGRPHPARSLRLPLEQLIVLGPILTDGSENTG